MRSKGRRVAVRLDGASRVATLMHGVIDSRCTRFIIRVLSRFMPPPRVTVTKLDLVVPQLPRHLNGLRLLHVSDLHLHAGSETAWQLPHLLAQLDFDAICYTGDFIEVDDDLPRLAELLAQMPSSLAFAVLGNHDHLPFGRLHVSSNNDASRLYEVLTRAGIKVLANEAVPILGGGVYIVGVDDPATARDDIVRAYTNVPMGTCTLLMAHSPDIVLRLATKRPSLILSGHTHGGQVRIPLLSRFIRLTEVAREYTRGLVTFSGIPLFVSRGVGCSGVNIRIGSPPEVALLTLRSGR